jgi:hypothetical protein
MQSIQEIFDQPRFRSANSAVVQKLRPDEHNLEGLQFGYTESWPAIRQDFDLIVLAFETDDSQVRKLYAGFLMKVEGSVSYSGLYRLYADAFIPVGVHDRRLVSDAKFYDKDGAGGGSREVAIRTGFDAADMEVVDADVPPGMDERRLVWVRRNHKHFRDPVRLHWNGRCAVHDHECSGILVASHIYPWRFSDKQQKTDRHNGLLLSAPLDSLFDRGLISFDDDGNILLSPRLDKQTRNVFSVKAGMTLRRDRLTNPMRRYLAKHRQLFSYN